MPGAFKVRLNIILIAEAFYNTTYVYMTNESREKNKQLGDLRTKVEKIRKRKF